MDMENIIYESYDGSIQIDMDTLLVSIWNVYIEMEAGGDNKIFLNDKDFFEKKFDNAYDAAWAVSLSGVWKWTDRFVYFNEGGYVTSFSHWDDENSPIDLDKINISPLIDGLINSLQKNKKGGISPAIHDALQEI